MARVNADLELRDYITDFGETIAKLPFSFEENGLDPGPLVDQTYPVRENNISCSTSKLFSPRKLVLTFTNGTSTELPIASLSDIENSVTTALANALVACVAVKGERWVKVPPAKLRNGTQYSTSLIDSAIKPARQGYTFNYRLDANTNVVQVRKNYQVEPQEIYFAQIDCLEDATTQKSPACSFSDALDLRHFIGTRGTNQGGTISRKIFVSSGISSAIATCGQEIAPYFNCLGYEGTSMKDASIFYSQN